MTYLLLDAAFLAVAATVLTVALRRRGRRRGQAHRHGAVRQGVQPTSMVLAAAVLVVMTIVFDNVMIAAGLFRYAPEHLVGVMLWRAPVEDLGYPIAAALLLPSLWHLLGGRSSTDGHRREDA